MSRLSLSANKREITGRKVKKLRREGILPANLYGQKTKSLSLQLPLKEFQKVYGETGESSLVDLVVDKVTHPVLIHGVQTGPVSDVPLPADFHEVSLTEKTTAMIPIELVGESPAVVQQVGILIQPLGEVEVEALPQDLPEKLTVDVSGLVEVGSSLTVNQIKTNEKITLKASPDEVVAKIDELAKEEEIAPPPAEKAAEGEVEVPAPGEVSEETQEQKEETKEAAPEASPPQEQTE